MITKQTSAYPGRDEVLEVAIGEKARCCRGVTLLSLGEEPHQFVELLEGKDPLSCEAADAVPLDPSWEADRELVFFIVFFIERRTIKK